MSLSGSRLPALIPPISGYSGQPVGRGDDRRVHPYSQDAGPYRIRYRQLEGVLGARDAYPRLCDSLQLATLVPVMPMPKPIDRLTADRLAIVAPGARFPLLTNVSFELRAGEGMGIIGPSGSGKTTLARAIVGVWTPSSGSIRLDGADLRHWNRSQLGSHIGYLPQDLGLPDATVRDTISRYDPNASPEAIIRAAENAGAHELILSLADGYETRIGENGHILSGGQRQRIGLARALYGDPFLVVLDEPNANLDNDGDVALSRAVASIRARGGIVIVVTHRPAGLASVDNVAFLDDRTIKLFGPKRDVLAALSNTPTMAPAPQVKGTSHV
jgi:ATP-binding cassette, subfamily C, bacterial PrsD